MWNTVKAVLASRKFWLAFLGGLVTGICGALGADPTAWQAVLNALGLATGGTP